MAEEPIAESVPRLRVLLLGPFGLERDGQRINTEAWQPRVRTLLMALVVAPRRQRLRDELIDLLWPEMDQERATGNLRMLVHRLRLALGLGDPSPVQSSQGWVALNPAYGWDLDIEELETVLREGDADIESLEHAAQLYRGEPCPEERYADWAAPVRTRAERLWRQLCLRLAELHLARGAAEESASWISRWLEVDPLDEEAVRLLLTTLTALGRHTEALRRYHELEQRLQTELEVPPAPVTSALAADIRARLEKLPASSAAASFAVPPRGRFLGATPDGPLVARDEELRRILLPVETIDEGGMTVFLAGEAGSGKTRLAQEVMLRLQQRGFFVVTGAGREVDRTVPYRLMLDVLARAYTAAPPSLQQEAPRRWPQLTWLLPRELSEKAADVMEEDDVDEEFLLARAVSGFLNALAAIRPVAVLLDDLQWADDGSLSLLHDLSVHTRGSRVFLLGTYRDGEIEPQQALGKLVRDLAREGLLERVYILRFDAEATSALVASVLGDMQGMDDFAEFVYHRTKGNARFIHRILRALGGRYRLVRPIGSGGMGRVFEATDSLSGERVAVKIMFARTEVDPRALLRFQQEAAVLAGLNHPNVVRIRDAFTDEHVSCIIMDLLPGRSLARVMSSESIGLSRLRHLMEQVCAALIAAHDSGVAHRDMKPDNVMVDDDDTVTVTDFGIARLTRPEPAVPTLTSTGMTMGTPWYAAPEQIEGRGVDARSDVYAVGAMLYHLVTGRPPFHGDSALSIALQHARTAPIPPRALNPDLPRDWEIVILRALAKDSGDRFQSMKDMARAIEVLSTPTSCVTPGAGMEPQEDGNDHVPLRMVGRRSFRNDGAHMQPTLLGRARSMGIGVVGLALLAVLVVRGLSPVLNTGSSPPSAPRVPGIGYAGSGPGQFQGPTGLGLDARGNVYVVDQGNNRIQEFSGAGFPIGQWGSYGKAPTQFEGPSDLAVTPDGTVWVVDHGTKRIKAFQFGQPVDEQEYDASGLAADARGHLFAPDFYAHVMHVLDPKSHQAEQWPVPSILGGRFAYPDGLAIGADGTLFVADRGHDRIQPLLPSGKPLRSFGSYGHKPGQFDAPTDIALDTHGNMYVADARNNRVQKLSAAGVPLAVWGKLGTGPRQFRQPDSIAVDIKGFIYVSDFYNNRVQKLSPRGHVVWVTHGRIPLRPGRP